MGHGRRRKRKRRVRHAADVRQRRTFSAAAAAAAATTATTPATTKCTVFHLESASRSHRRHVRSRSDLIVSLFFAVSFLFGGFDFFFFEQESIVTCTAFRWDALPNDVSCF